MRRHAGIARARERLHGHHVDRCQPERVVQRLQRADQVSRRAVRVRHDDSPPSLAQRQPLRLLPVDQRRVVGVDVRDQQRHVGVHAVRRGVGADRETCVGQLALRLRPAAAAGNGREEQLHVRVDRVRLGRHEPHLPRPPPACRRAAATWRPRHTSCPPTGPTRSAPRPRTTDDPPATGRTAGRPRRSRRGCPTLIFSLSGAV